MKTSELRIGNYVQGTDFNEEIKFMLRITGVDENSTLIDGNCTFALEPINKDAEDMEYYYNIEPIPLNESWLFKFGFEKVDVNTYFKQYYLENQGLRVHWFEGWICYQGFINNWNELTIIKYVHQLQNLYFALTGEELAKIN